MIIEGGKGHVGFVAGVNRRGAVVLLGGNQGNMVNYSSFSNIKGYIYPSGYTSNYNLQTVNVNTLNIIFPFCKKV
ncbi:hypothetical protein FACS189429_1880 [Bacteroidia bacterium]|nr:hypothetical protein FACS189429_1880 [Bacteroidia bacterium]